MKGRDREERETGMKVKKQNKNITSLPLPATRIAGLAQLSANIGWTPRVTKDTWHLRITQPPTREPDLEMIKANVLTNIHDDYINKTM